MARAKSGETVEIGNTRKKRGTPGKGDPPGPGATSTYRWWTPEVKDRRHQMCRQWVDRVMIRHSMRARIHLFNAQMYDDLPALGLGPYSYSRYDMGSSYLRMNLVRAVTNTYTSMVMKNKPKTRILTNDGDWALKKMAKGLQRWIEGRTEEIELYDKVSDPVCLDSGCFGTGLPMVYNPWPQDPELFDVCVKRIFPWELLTDDAEAQDPQRLRSAAYREWIDRSQLAEMYPEHRAYIMSAVPKASERFTTWDATVDTASDLVTVYTQWHLPSSPLAEDGLCVVWVDSKVLDEREWTSQRFPWVALHRDPATIGLWGVSIPHELRGLQTYINQALLDIEECQHMYGKPHWMVPRGAMPDTSALDDDIGSIVLYDGMQPPTVYTPTVMPPEVYSMLSTAWQRGFDLIGVSQSRGEGEAAPGLSGSGASIRAWNEVGDGRMYKPSSNYESMHLQVFDRMVDLARDIAKEKPDYASGYRGKKYVSIVKFADVDPGKNRYYIAKYPESRLSKNPAQRFAQLQEMFNAKVIQPDEFRELLEFPDIEADDNLMLAPRRIARMLVDRFLEADDPTADGVMMYPQPEWPLDTIMQFMALAYANATTDEAPEGNLQLFRQFSTLVDALKKRMAGPDPNAPPPAAGPPPPGALPAGPPPPNAPIPQQFKPGTLAPNGAPPAPPPQMR